MHSLTLMGAKIKGSIGLDPSALAVTVTAWPSWPMAAALGSQPLLSLSICLLLSVLNLSFFHKASYSWNLGSIQIIHGDVFILRSLT